MLRAFSFNKWTKEWLNLFCAIEHQDIQESQESQEIGSQGDTAATTTIIAHAPLSHNSQESLDANNAATNARTSTASSNDVSSQESQEDIGHEIEQESQENQAAQRQVGAAATPIPTPSVAVRSSKSELFQVDMRGIFAMHFTFLVQADMANLIAFDRNHESVQSSRTWGAYMIQLDNIMRTLRPGEPVPESFLNPPGDPIGEADPRNIRDQLKYYEHPLPYVNTTAYLRTIRELQRAGYNHSDIVNDLVDD